MTKAGKLVSITVFCVVEFALLITLLFGGGELARIASFASIALAFAFSLLFLSIKHKKIITQLALLFTVCADVCLVLARPQNQSLGMSFFSIVQILYFVRLLLETPNKQIRLANLISRCVAIVAVVVTTLCVLGTKADYLSLISMFYFTNLVLNVVFAFINIKTNPLLAIGLLLFMFCDFIIGLQCAIGVYIDIPSTSFLYQLAFSSFNWAWLFYLPSQAILSISSINQK